MVKVKITVMGFASVTHYLLLTTPHEKNTDCFDLWTHKQSNYKHNNKTRILMNLVSYKML